MRRSLLVLSVMPLLAVGCGEDRGRTGTTATATTPVGGGTSEVPAGVAEQYRTIEEEVREEGGETRSGPWRIAYIVEPAEGWFERRGGRFEWRPPVRGETNHIEILPIEAETGRIVPDVTVVLEVLDADGDRVARKPLSFHYAEFFHYAENFALPGQGGTRSGPRSASRRFAGTERSRRGHGSPKPRRWSSRTSTSRPRRGRQRSERCPVDSSVRDRWARFHRDAPDARAARPRHPTTSGPAARFKRWDDGAQGGQQPRRHADSEP